MAAAHDVATIFQGFNGDWYFNVRARNGEVIAQSEGYERKQSARDVVEQHFPGVSIVEEDEGEPHG